MYIYYYYLLIHDYTVISNHPYVYIYIHISHGFADHSLIQTCRQIPCLDSTRSEEQRDSVLMENRNLQNLDKMVLTKSRQNEPYKT